MSAACFLSNGKQKFSHPEIPGVNPLQIEQEIVIQWKAKESPRILPRWGLIHSVQRDASVQSPS
jgi:hypothetical protein